MHDRNTPCYECPRRWAECHVVCEEYATWNAAHIRARDEAYEARTAEAAINGFLINQGKRTRHDNIRKSGEKKRRGIR